MKKIFALFLTGVLLAGLLAGCGGGTEAYTENGMAMDMEMQAEAPGEALQSVTADSSTGSTQYADQKLVKTVKLQAETADLDTLLAGLTEQISALGGYTEYQNIYNGSTYSHRRVRTAELTIRIPADKLNSFVQEVEGTSNVISKTEDIDDVTLQYVDTQSRMNALQAEHDRLVELMEKADNLTDLLTIEERLTEVRYKLESATSQLRVMDNQVSYATIELAIEEVEVYTEVEEPTVWERISTGFMTNLQNLGDFLVDLLVWVVTCSPQLLIFAGFIALVIWLCRKALGKHKPRKHPFTPPQPPEEKD